MFLIVEIEANQKGWTMSVNAIYCYGMIVEEFNGKPITKVIEWFCQQAQIDYPGEGVGRFRFPEFLEMFKRQKGSGVGSLDLNLIRYNSTSSPKYVLAVGESVCCSPTGMVNIVSMRVNTTVEVEWIGLLKLFCRSVGLPDSIVPKFLLLIED